VKARETREARGKWLATLDPGIARYVDILNAHGVETFESCQGGEGHCFPEPTVRFSGQKGAGWQALEVAFNHGFPVRALRRYWSIQDDEPVGPNWELVFSRAAKPLLDEEVKEPPPWPAWICAAHAPSDR